MKLRRREWLVLSLSLYVLLAVTSWQLRAGGITGLRFADLLLLDALACGLVYLYFARRPARRAEGSDDFAALAATNPVAA
jgi:hypothetical protein